MMRGFSLLVAVAIAEVIELTADNFDAETGTGYALVKMVAPWCGHCKNLTPEYEKASETLESEGIKVKLGSLDATKETEIASKFGVKGYPSLKWFTDGEASEYDGGRKAADIVKWVKMMTGPAVEHVTEVPEPVKNQPVILFTGEKLSEDFDQVAKKNRNKGKFFFKVAPETKMTLQHGTEPVVAYDGPLTMKDMLKFITDNQMPLFGSLDGVTFATYTGRSIGLVWSLFEMDKNDDPHAVADKHREEMTKVAKEFQGQFSVTYTDTIKFKDAIESMLGITEFPRIAVNKKAGDKKKYIYDGEIKAEPIIQFIKDVQSGAVKAELKSQPEDSLAAEAPVVGVTSARMRELVFDAERDVIFAVTAPWCGHCKKLKPDYKKLATKVQKEGMEDLIRIAEMDGTQNDSSIDSIEWSGFPSMFFVKAGSNDPTKYSGGRTAKDMWAYFKEHGANKDEIVKRLGAKGDERVDEDKDEL